MWGRGKKKFSLSGGEPTPSTQSFGLRGGGGAGSTVTMESYVSADNNASSNSLCSPDGDAGLVLKTIKDGRTNGYGGSSVSSPTAGALDKQRELAALNDGGSSDGGGDGDGCGAMCGRHARRMARDACSLRQVTKRVPIVTWLPKYDRDKAISDFIAGITVGLTVIPQGIAYANVAEMPEEYGLYSAFMGCFMYAIFGSCKDVTVGPTAIVSLMTAEYAARENNPDFAVLAAFLSGVIILLLGLFRLGFVIDFISVSVTAGFTSAAAISIATGQVDELLGLKKNWHSESEGIQGDLYEIFKNIETIRWQDTIMGVVCAIVLLYMRWMKDNSWFVHPSEVEGEPTCMQRLTARLSPMARTILSKTVWVMSTARNAVIVVVCILVAMAFNPELPDSREDSTFILTGEVKDGLPKFKPPPFSTTDPETKEEYAFIDMLKELGSGIIILPLIAVLENVAIAKSFSGGKPIDANQEMIALGVCNFMGSFVSSYPTTGSFSRTAVNAASGVKTPWGGVYTGSLVLLALAVLMPYCAYIPKAALAAVIITAVIFSVEFHVIRPMWKSKKSDLVVMFVTFCCCLFWSLEYGILVGAGLQIMFILYHTARPNITVDQETLVGPGTEYLLVRIDRSLVFPAVNHVRAAVNKIGIRQGQAQRPLVVDCAHIFTADFTAAEGFADMARDFGKRGQAVLFLNMPLGVEATMKGPDEHGAIEAVRGHEQLAQALHEIFASRVEAGVIGGGVAVLDNAVYDDPPPSLPSEPDSPPPPPPASNVASAPLEPLLDGETSSSNNSKGRDDRDSIEAKDNDHDDNSSSSSSSDDDDEGDKSAVKS